MVTEIFDDCQQAALEDSRMNPPPAPETVSTSPCWEVATHRSNIDWAGEYDIPRVDIGDIVRIIVGPNTLRLLQEIGGQNNTPKIGQLLPAVVVKSWNSGRVNLKVWTDGTRDVWLTAVDYYPVHLQRSMPGNPGLSLLHGREDTYHSLNEPSEWMEESPVVESFLEIEAIGDEGVNSIRITHRDGHIVDLGVEDARDVAINILEMLKD